MPVSTLSRKQAAYDALLGRILGRELLPGDLLNRRTVAADLQMSTAPVLEAMVQLSTEGFLETLPRKGTRVRLVRPADVQGLLVVREALECQGARHCCGAPVRAALPRLTRLAQAAERSWRQQTRACWQAELDLHRALMLLAACPALLQAFDQVMTRAFFFLVAQALSAPPQATTIHHSHVTLVQALCTDDPDVAEAAMRTHVRSGKTAILQV